MDIDWCPEENLKNLSQFNENSIIFNKKKKVQIQIVMKLNKLLMISI